MGGTRHNGFTLMEMMMALAVIGVVVAITIPNFQTFLLNNRMTGAANDLLAAVNVARSEAIKRQRTVGICTSTDPKADPPSCTNELDDVGSIGWAVWLDTDRDAALDAGEEVLVRHDPLAALTLSTSSRPPSPKAHPRRSSCATSAVTRRPASCCVGGS
jgi:type IV fimbrial biogenesis protein FimT